MRLLAENLTTLASAIAVCLAAGAAYHARLPWLQTSYLMVQCAFALIGWWALCREGAYRSRTYFVLFTVLFFAVQAFAAIIACDFSAPTWIALGLIVNSGIAVAFGAFRLYAAIVARGDATVDLARVKMLLIWGATLLFSGFLTLLALADPLLPSMRIALEGMGLFWLALGAWSWTYAASQSRAWDTANLFVTPMLALVFFLWMFRALSGAQPEAATQNSRDEVSLSELEHLAEVL